MRACSGRLPDADQFLTIADSLGNVGAEVARRAVAFEMRVLYYDVVSHPELEEELGIAGATPELFDTLPASLETGNEFVHAYSVISDQSLRLNREEIADGRWCSVDDLERWINAEPDRFTSAFRLIFERFRAKF